MTFIIKCQMKVIEASCESIQTLLYNQQCASNKRIKLLKLSIFVLALTGLNKAETAEKHGEEQVMQT